MKANYENEDYKMNIKMILMIFGIILFLTIWEIFNFLQNGIEAKGIILFFFFLVPLLIVQVFLYKEKKKKMSRREQNQLIMQKGQVVEGTILKIWTEKTEVGIDSDSRHVIRNNKAKVSFQYQNQEKIIELDQLCFRVKEQYNGKKVKVYILDSENIYVDIINEVERSKSYEK